MTMAPVGVRCPDHASGNVRPTRAKINPPRVARAPGRVMAARITGGLIALNVIVYVITLVQGGHSGFNNPGGSLYDKWVLFGPFVDRGDWWRLVTAMFLHGFLLHIVFNMVALWFVGRAVELYLGPTRFLLLYFVSGLAGSAGALIQSPTTPVVGASGAIFGILGALLILEWQATGRFAGQALTWIVINLVLNLSYGGNVSIGGHIGGLIGGILVTLSFASWRRGRSRTIGGVTPEGAVGLIVVAAASVAVSYWKVRGLWPMG